VGIIGIHRDVTEQKRAEEKIQEAVRRRDQFLAMLSHELRNPLGAIMTATTLLKQRAGDSKLVQILTRQSHQMARLLDDLLEASRVTQNKIELRRAVVSLTTIVEDAVETARSAMDERGITLEVHLEDAPLDVLGDEARLLQIHMNLLSNATKYTPRGGHVLVEVRRDGAQAVVRVKDDGAGISAEMIGHVFDLFVQSRRTLDRADGGLGVGLTLVKALVEMHGGTVTARSDGDAKGSEFVIRLPLATTREAQETPRAPRSLRLKPGARIVVIEDNADSCEMLCELLTAAGFDCKTAADGAAGLRLMEEVRPVVAIVDLGLPAVDGFELARTLRRDPRFARTYLIALTGYGQRADREAALRAGFDEHLVKPIDSRTLMQVLMALGPAGGGPSRGSNGDVGALPRS
jgi:two-component system CheB/CheR fusion protein